MSQPKTPAVPADSPLTPEQEAVVARVLAISRCHRAAAEAALDLIYAVGLCLIADGLTPSQDQCMSHLMRETHRIALAHETLKTPHH